MRFKENYTKLISFLFILVLIVFSLVYLARVPSYPNNSTVQKHLIILNSKFIQENINPTDDVQKVILVQKYVLNDIAPLNRPEYNRIKVLELADLEKSEMGMCYDRSRAIETLLHYVGYSVRHVFIVSNNNNLGYLNLIIPKISTHAMTEVKVNGKWLVIGSNTGFFAVDSNGNVHSVHQVNNNK